MLACFPFASDPCQSRARKFFDVDLHFTPCFELLHHVQQSYYSFWGLSKDLDVIDEIYVLKLIAVVGVLIAVFLVFANLQTMADTLILPSRREHPQQSVDKKLNSSGDVMLPCATPVLNVILAISASFGARRTVALS